MGVDPHAVSTTGFRGELKDAAAESERLGDDAALAMVWSELTHVEWMPCRFETPIGRGVERSSTPGGRGTRGSSPRRSSL
jgi:hypothetical protein